MHQAQVKRQRGCISHYPVFPAGIDLADQETFHPASVTMTPGIAPHQSFRTKPFLPLDEYLFGNPRIIQCGWNLKRGKRRVFVLTGQFQSLQNARPQPGTLFF
jgi:hypothetical protein